MINDAWMRSHAESNNKTQKKRKLANRPTSRSFRLDRILCAQVSEQMKKKREKMS